ncbi:MAG: alpha/beta fold hydrolase [Arenicellales bacterium]|nr:alpha/beta fold hydrolase [Arenicellales bacterium]
MQSHVVQSGWTADQHPTVILIHGLGGNLHLWDQVVPVLEKRFSVLRYDLRGHGQSDAPSGDWSLDDFAKDLLELFDSRMLARAHLVGFSLGGLIVQQFALSHPERVERLIILSAVAGRTEEERQQVRERLRNLENGQLDTNIELALERWFSPTFRRDHPERVQKRIAELRATPPDGYLKAQRVFVLSDLADQLDRIQCPTLIMTGEHDPGSNVRMARIMHEKIRGSQLEILPELRHSILVEAPKLVAEKLDRFLI